MAQQIQFIYLTQSDYDGLTPQTSKIYFTSDTKRIYKGVDLYAATTFDQLNFSAIEASSITVDGSAVSLEGHSHSMSDISGLDSAISAATSNFATWGHQHAIADVTNLPGIVSGITTTGITKSNGNFTNLNATSIQASAIDVTGTGTFSSVSASTATFGNLVVTGDVSMTLSQVTFGSIMASVSMTLSQVTFGSIMASDIQVNGTSVALVGHTHVMSEITDFDTTAFASSNHTHPELSGLTSSTITKETGTFTNLVVASASFTATNVEAEEISASTATFGDINVTGTASLSTTNVTASTLTAGAGSFTTLTVGGSSVALVGHTHPASEVTGLQSVLDGLSSTYALASHSHAISDITNLAPILSGITSSSIEKDTVTADIGYFRLLSVSGSANFAVNTVSANAVTVNGTEVALSGHTHSVADIDGLSTALGGFASSGHTHAELTGITQTSISKANANFTTVTANAGTFNTLTTTDLNFTNLSISSAAVSSMTVANLNVTNTLKLNNKDIATQEYVQLMISQAIGQALASAY